MIKTLNTAIHKSNLNEWFSLTLKTKLTKTEQQQLQRILFLLTSFHRRYWELISNKWTIGRMSNKQDCLPLLIDATKYKSISLYPPPPFLAKITFCHEDKE